MQTSVHRRARGDRRITGILDAASSSSSPPSSALFARTGIDRATYLDRKVLR